MAREQSDKPTVANRIRLAREQAGLSQGQVASLLKMHRPTISEIEAGRRKVSTEELSRFAELFDVDVRWLIGLQADSSSSDDRIFLAARELAKLDKDDIDRVLKLLKTLRRKSDGNHG